MNVSFTKIMFSKALLAVAAFIVVVGCEQLVEVEPPPTSLTSENVFSNDATAAAVLTGIYSSLASFTPVRAQTINSISLISGLSADELTLYGGSSNVNSRLVQFYQNNLNPDGSSHVATLWSEFYSKLYVVNLALERLQEADGVTAPVRQQLMGEARFLRAFFYFYLVNLYGGVPLTTTSDYRVNSTLSRSSEEAVYNQIVTDLKEAQNLLSQNYVAGNARDNTSERLRPNKWVATALLARTYLFMGLWAEAENEASSLINNVALYDTTSLENVFLRNSKEAIWQLQPVRAGWNTEDARVFVLPPTGPTSNSTVGGYPVFVSTRWVDNFEPNDKRRVEWLGSVTVGGTTYSYPHKYKNATLDNTVTEYAMVFRLGEQYLIRAEARAQMGNVSGAASDLDVIRARAGLPPTTASDPASLVTAVLQEKRIELFSEWGHRWLDLKRSETIETVMTTEAPFKSASWSSADQLYPIPLYDILQNPNLVQNPGY